MKRVVNFDTGENKPWDEYRKAQQFLSQNAFRLMAAREQILADERLAMTIVDVGCNLAYTGACGLRGATLGTWLTWWAESEHSFAEVKGQGRLPIIFFAGSPLSGSNKCNCVDANGKCYGVSVGSFSSVWHSFMDTNKQFTPKDYSGDRATLEEIIELLSQTK